MTPWDQIEEELSCWRREGRQASLWWRDDDAAADAPALRRLTTLAGRQAAPLALAVIPAILETATVDHLQGTGAAISVLQHGFAHRNHAPNGEKKIELGAHRPLDLVRDELAAGQDRLAKAFGERFLPIMVPPWNRIAATVAAALPAMGYRGLSTYGPRQHATAAPGLTRVNCHLDLMAWKPDRRFRGTQALCSALAAQLRDRRQGRCDRDEPTGLLSHHLVHEELCWTFLESLLERVSAHRGARLLGGPEVFAARAAG